MEQEDVKFFRLVTGEDIISEVVEMSIDDKTIYTLLNPMKIVYMMGKPGFLSISMMEWIFSRICDVQEFNLKPNDILTVGQPSENLITYYHECVDNFEAKRQILNKKVEFGAPTENHEDIPSEYTDEDDTSAMEELQEIIKNTLDNKKRILH